MEVRWVQRMEFMERIQHEGCKPNIHTYNVGIKHWCDEGEMEKALELFGKLKGGRDCLPNLDTYNVIIRSIFMRKWSEDMGGW